MQMDKPKISIILPTYNGERFIKKSLDSCLEQTHANLELIIVNDGSNDRTDQIVRSYTDQRIKYIALNENIGLPKALNKGFAASTGDFLTWMSDDNYYTPQAIEHMLDYLNSHAKIDFVYSLYHVVDEDGKILRSGHVSSPKDLDIDNYIGLCFLYRRKVYEEIGDFNPDAFLAEDYEYWLRVREKFSMKKLDEYLYFYRVHPGSLTSIYKEDAVQKQVETVRARFISRAKNDYFMARKSFFANDTQTAKQHIKVSLLRGPINYEGWRLFFMLYAHPDVVANLRHLKNLFKKK